MVGEPSPDTHNRMNPPISRAEASVISSNGVHIWLVHRRKSGAEIEEIASARRMIEALLEPQPTACE